jgi:hypothetical protein
MDFVPFTKIARLRREVVVTEKLDGTNAAVYISDDGLQIQAASRSRFITPTDDNYGFAKWVEANKEELLAKLGSGIHHGEWWGSGIQRGYGLKEKRFSLFNAARWSDPAVRPACCHVVPVLGQLVFDTPRINYIFEQLKQNGSVAAPGFMKPEGIVVFHTGANQDIFKVTYEGDDEGKERTIAKAAKSFDS